MSHYNYGNNHHTGNVVEVTPVIKVDYVYSEIIGRKILAEYFKGLFERVDAGIKWATRAVYYLGTGYVLATLTVPIGSLIPLIHIPFDKLHVLNVMAASKYTILTTGACLVARGFVSWLVLPFARHAYNRCDREATNYINMSNQN